MARGLQKGREYRNGIFLAFPLKCNNEGHE